MRAAPVTSSDHMRTFEEGAARAEADEQEKRRLGDLDALRTTLLRTSPSTRARELYRQTADAVMLVAGDFDEPERRLFEKVAGMLFERTTP